MTTKCISHDLRASILQAIMDAEWYQDNQAQNYERSGVKEIILEDGTAQATLEIAKGHRAVAQKYRETMEQVRQLEVCE